MEKVAKQVLKRNRKKLFILSFEWSDDDRLAALEVFEEIFKNKISANVPPPRPARASFHLQEIFIIFHNSMTS